VVSKMGIIAVYIGRFSEVYSKEKWFEGRYSALPSEILAVPPTIDSTVAFSSIAPVPPQSYEAVGEMSGELPDR
jgi:hypothetical protein